MHLRELFKGQYLIYGLSIVVARGAELAVMFFAAHYLAKAVYGELEYYKKVLELGGAFLSFGFPALILTYTRSRQSKVYLLTYAVGFVLGLSFVLLAVLALLHQTWLWGGFLFYALFFTGGVVPVYFLVKKGSVAASLYKMGIALTFFFLVFEIILHFSRPERSFAYASFVLLVPSMLWLIYEGIIYEKISFPVFVRYARHFRKLLYGSLTLIINNLSNLAFLYTDIFMIKILSENPAPDIANYGFPLNIANVLMLIPLTLVQVEIENIKKRSSFLKTVTRKIIFLDVIAIILLVPAYYYLVNHFYTKFSVTITVFLILLTAKFFQTLSVGYGTTLLIFKKYNINLSVNLLMIVIHIIFSYIFFGIWGIKGVAAASAGSLTIRFLILRYFYHRYATD